MILLFDLHNILDDPTRYLIFVEKMLLLYLKKFMGAKKSLR
jgi:hypothetical protein